MMTLGLITAELRHKQRERKRDTARERERDKTGTRKRRKGTLTNHIKEKGKLKSFQFHSKKKFKTIFSLKSAVK